MTENAWTLHGNAGIDPARDFLGTTDAQPVVIKAHDSEAIRVNPSGRIGVGLTDPRTPLHVLGRIASGLDFAAPGTITFFPPDGFAWFHIDNGPSEGRPIGRLRLSSGANPGDVEIMSFVQDGTVGVGTSAPRAKVHIESNGDFNAPQVIVSQTRPFEFARLRFPSVGVEPDSQRTVAFPLWDIAAGQGELRIFVEGAGNVMNFVADGKVGIGTEHPASTLHVRGTATVGVLDITGGADLAEAFDMSDDQAAEPGTVMVIDEHHDGMLKISHEAYDRKVAGVVSGADGHGPGITLAHPYLVERACRL